MRSTAVLDGTTPYDVARIVSQAVPPVGCCSSARPARSATSTWWLGPTRSARRRLVIGNRGLAGIDGTLSTAIGAALARPSSRAIAYVGDLTFLHGSNGLLIGPDEPRPDLTIVVASDDGGSIFSTLEQGAPEYADSFERVYATPTGADIGALCKGYGIAASHRLAVSARRRARRDDHRHPGPGGAGRPPRAPGPRRPRSTPPCGPPCNADTCCVMVMPAVGL